MFYLKKQFDHYEQKFAMKMMFASFSLILL